ncbi:AMP-binding protein, partial [Longispora fulva]|uniref:AMP-binding protein n=2 Tax=Bacteria TaxID=2 RepID=UPI00362CD1FC
QADLQKWFDQIDIDFVITPEAELSKLAHKHRQKLVLKELRNFSGKKNIPVIDSCKDLDLDALFRSRKPLLSASEKSSAKAIFEEVSSEDIALLITTSGSSGASKIIAYEHGAFLRNLSAWKAAGLFAPGKLGGRSFTPLFTHTMGIRTFMNGLYLGQPIILINTDWFTERPETVRYFLGRAKPQHITGGPAVFRLLLEMSRTFPDLKTSLSKNLKTLVS